MRAAPPVQAPIDGRGVWHWAQGTLHALAAGCVAYWLALLLEWPTTGWAVLCALVVGVLAAAWAGRCWPPLRGRLCWDGVAWTVELDGGGRWGGRPTPAIDLGRWMLVRFAVPEGPAGSSRVMWLPLAQAGAGAHWSLLRAALFDASPAGGAAAPRTGLDDR